MSNFSEINGAQLRNQLHQELTKVIVGQTGLIDYLFCSLIAGGHVLLEGPPGTAKTLIASAFAKTIGGTFKRIQFTPDLLPSDITGNLVLSENELVFRKGPLFANVVLADEINRTPPKTQAALLQAMGENVVTIAGTDYPLDDPFMVIATQNPIEYEGTYPLPEAQLDRFFMKLIVSYPTESEESEIYVRPRRGASSLILDNINQVISKSDLPSIRKIVDSVIVSDQCISYLTSIIRQSRSLPSVQLGLSPRAGVHLLAASKTYSYLAGRSYVVPDDINILARVVLPHRLVLTPEAQLDNFTQGDAILNLLGSIEIPR